MEHGPRSELRMRSLRDPDRTPPSGRNPPVNERATIQRAFDHHHPLRRRSDLCRMLFRRRLLLCPGRPPEPPRRRDCVLGQSTQHALQQVAANAESAHVLVRHRNEDLPDSSVRVHRCDRRALRDPRSRPPPGIPRRDLIPSTSEPLVTPGDRAPASTDSHGVRAANNARTFLAHMA